MKKIKFIMQLIIVTVICCSNILTVNAESSKVKDNTEQILELATDFILSTGIPMDELEKMNNSTKLEIYNTFKEMRALDDDIEFKGSNQKTLSITTNKIESRNIPKEKLKFNTYSFDNHQMGRVEGFASFEWKNMPFEQLVNNDTFAFSIGEGWDILDGGHALSLYRVDGEFIHKFTRPSECSRYGAAYHMDTPGAKEFRLVNYGVAHFSLRPNRNIPISELDNFISLLYIQDLSWLNIASVSLSWGPASVSVQAPSSMFIHKAGYSGTLY